MKKLVSISICLFLGTQLLLAQNILKFELNEKKNDVIYLEVNDKNEVYYFVDNKCNLLDSKKNGNGKDNQINIYMKWMNPLKYKITWKDTSFIDERDIAINDFITLLVNQFGAPLLDQNPSKTTRITPSKKSDSINKIEFKDFNLLYLNRYLCKNDTMLDPNSIQLINQFMDSLKLFEDLVLMDVSTETQYIYSTMYNYKDIRDFNNTETGFDMMSQKFKEIILNFDTIAKLKKFIENRMKIEFNKDELLQIYFTATITNFLEKSIIKLNHDKQLVEKLNPIFSIFLKSVEEESVKHRGYYKMRTIEFENGKKMQTEMIIQEFELNKETDKLTLKSEVLRKKISFQKYDLFDIFISTGLIYSNSILTSYGVDNIGNDFILTEKEIKKYNPGAALFLNFNIRISRYFSPLVQIGIDPTKKSPFLLLGTGFLIPVAKFAISGGPIWTWNQTLNKLTVGQTIGATTDLENDITYNFDLIPKGWYIGIQYKF